MRQLFAYILKQYFFFLFILLEIISFSFIVQKNYHHSIFINSSNKITGSVFTAFTNITEYFTLRKANNVLVEENAHLRNILPGSFNFTDSLVYYHKDSLYKYIGAKVISNSINKRKNYLMINKGYKHGIGNDMGVITSRGIVGTVVEVSKDYSLIMSVLHINNKINSRIKKNMHLGNTEWEGFDYRKGILTDIPTHVRLNNGDTIITSGNSHIFPEGILIGTVDEYYSKPGDKFNKAQIDFAVDYNNVYFVYIIINLMRDEQLKLEESVTDE